MLISKPKCKMQAFKEGGLDCTCEISIFLYMHTENGVLLEKPHPADKNLYPSRSEELNSTSMFPGCSSLS